MKEKTQTVHMSRGFWLSLLLVVIGLQGIFGTALYYSIRTQDALDRPWLISLMVLHSLANVIAAIGIWYWKKWALYIFSISTILAIFVGLVSIGVWSLFYMLLPLVFLGWLLRTKWHYFE